MYIRKLLTHTTNCNLLGERGIQLSKQNDDKSAMEKYDERLKGTFVTVIFIGVFILLSWFGIFYYYITTL